MKKTKMLKKNYEFKSVLSAGKYYSGKYIEAFIKRAKIEDYNFLGIAIGVKTGKAVRRNRLKRLIRENYKNYENSLKLGNSIVFLLKKNVEIGSATFENIKKDMEIIFYKSNIFEDS